MYERGECRILVKKKITKSEQRERQMSSQEVLSVMSIVKLRGKKREIK